MTAKLHLLLMSIYNGRSYGKLSNVGWQLRAPPTVTGGAANHYFVLKIHLRLRLFWAVAPSYQVDLGMI